MSAQNGFQRASRLGARYEGMELDLNRSPPRETQEGEGSSSLQSQVPRIDVDLTQDGDHIIESSPTTFVQTARRTPGPPTIHEIVDQIRAFGNGHNEYRTGLQRTPIVNSSNHISSEECRNSMNENARKEPKSPKEIIFKCPICMDPLVEEMSTMCGHIFCKECISASIAAQGKCPICRENVAKKDLIRVFLPSTN